MTKTQFKIGDVVKHKISDQKMVIIGLLHEVPSRDKYTRDEAGTKKYNAAYALATKNKKLAGYQVRVMDYAGNGFKQLQFHAEELVAVKS